MPKYEEIIRLLNVPKIIIPYLNIIYTDDDLEVIAAIKDKVLSANQIEIAVGKPVQAILDNAYKTATVDKVLDNKTIKYRVSSLSNRLDKLATFERKKWDSISSEGRKKISEWLFNDYLQGKQNSTLEEIINSGNKILPLKDTIDFLKTIQNDIYVIPCDCKSITENCDFDKNVCLSSSSGINTASDRGHGKKINLQEAVELLQHTDKIGLIHSVEKNAICNCCSCCCYPLRASERLGLKGKWPGVDYIVSIDTEKCVNCGICIKRCQQNVFEKREKVINMDSSRCLGCGICISTCPQKALTLKKPSI